MAAVKESSTIQENKQYALQRCPVTHTMDKIGGHWKPIILYHLSSGDKQYSELRRAVSAITEKVLVQQLKQLETDGVIIREARPVVPPHVTYRLSKAGQGLTPVIQAMAEWALRDMDGAFEKPEDSKRLRK